MGLSVRTSKALQRPYPFISVKAEAAELVKDPSYLGGSVCCHEIESTNISKNTNNESKNDLRTLVLTFHTLMYKK